MCNVRLATWKILIRSSVYKQPTQILIFYIYLDKYRDWRPSGAECVKGWVGERETKIWVMEKRIWAKGIISLGFWVDSVTICVCVWGGSGRDMCVSMSVCLDYTEQVKGKLSTLLQTILKSDGQEKKETSWFECKCHSALRVNCLLFMLTVPQHNKNLTDCASDDTFCRSHLRPTVNCVHTRLAWQRGPLLKFLQEKGKLLVKQVRRQPISQWGVCWSSLTLLWAVPSLWP